MKLLPISIIIPTMNRPGTLNETIISFLSCEYIPAQIIVVDQTQDADMQAKIKESLFTYDTNSKIEYIYQSIPSLTKARNRGWEAVTQEIVICSDDDVCINSDTLENIHNIMKNFSIAMIAGIDENSSPSSGKMGYLLGTKSLANRKIGHVTLSMLGRYPDNIAGEIETQWAMGYFFVVRKSLADKWNLKWDENLTSYAYAEDLDYSYEYYKRAKAENLRCVLNDRVKVKHMVSKEYRIPSKKSLYMYVINRAYLSYKHNMGVKSRIAMKWCNFWMTVNFLIHKKNPHYMIEARKLCKKIYRNRFENLSKYFDF